MRSEAAANALVLVGPAALLGGALLFQHVGGLYPCEMCIWQRWPHAAALVLGCVAWAMRSNRAVVALAAVAVLVSGAIGVFHAGVELKWWEGVTACSANLAGGSQADIMASILNTPLVRCDAVAWSLFGISMAGWNAILSTGIGGGTLWLLARK
ncbi:disulfide bond formation protein B [Glacieibacterium frigidum]|uniref:Disulfide bond formation protein B n=1 Tax=Glacieibacterium frigidum TaxID=2593303 RepID=A0A552UFV4_9SPHN|nr:disulfide bond formation protein B [Glacieibacterium frigidum]TRW17102.1 disulfide bond formation protein B [Glacieibacterium frigidum]